MNLKAKKANIFRFPLLGGLGYGYCIYYDLTNYSTFSGEVIFVLDHYDNGLSDSLDFMKMKIAFGPVCLHKKPAGTRFPGWKLIKTDDLPLVVNIKFKDFVGNLQKSNWTLLKPWEIVDGFEKSIGEFPYEEIRNLETMIIHSGSGVQKRATIYFLLSENKSINEFLYSKDHGTLNMIIMVINTSIKREVAEHYIKIINEIDPSRSC